MSDTVALLNPQLELEVAQRMLRIARLRKEREEQRMLTSCLDRETYLKTFGAMVALSDTLDALEHEYGRMVNK
jgi:DnaJ-domain-containing protein 1